MAAPAEPVLIWGGGGHGKVVADVARACGFSVRGFIDADPAKLGVVVEPGGASVVTLQEDFVGSLEREDRGAAAPVALAVGDNTARQRCASRVPDDLLVTLVHPSAMVSPSAHIGSGTVVFPTAVVNAAAEVGKGCILNTGAVVEHDCRVGAAAHVSPGAVLAGGVTVGTRSWIGAGAVVLPGVVIGEDVTVGAGAVVLRDVPDGVTVVGNPARQLRHMGLRHGGRQS